MGYMFDSNCELKALNLENFNTNKVTNMDSMFNQCYNLESLDLSKFNTTNVRSMNFMFYQCIGLKELNLVSFITENCANFRDMFGDMNETTIYVQNRTNCNNMISLIPEELTVIYEDF